MDDIQCPIPARPVKFLDQFRQFIRVDGKGYATENTYVYWVKPFILFHNKIVGNTHFKKTIIKKNRALYFEKHVSRSLKPSVS